MHHKTTAEIFYENLNHYLQARPNLSMNHLSREIGANKGYLQKMIENQGTPNRAWHIESIRARKHL